MSWKTFLPIVVSVLIAVAGSFFLYQWMDKQKTPVEVMEVVKKEEAVPVAVAAANLPWGAKIKPEMVKTAPFLKESLPEGYFVRTADLKDRVILTPLKMNEPITEAKLAPISVKTGGVSAILKPGTRAIAIKGVCYSHGDRPQHKKNKIQNCTRKFARTGNRHRDSKERKRGADAC
jgi:pilus assembly protein CpaB